LEIYATSQVGGNNANLGKKKLACKKVITVIIVLPFSDDIQKINKKEVETDEENSVSHSWYYCSRRTGF
jgi:hypothetical protein